MLQHSSPTPSPPKGKGLRSNYYFQTRHALSSCQHKIHKKLLYKFLILEFCWLKDGVRVLFKNIILILTRRRFLKSRINYINFVIGNVDWSFYWNYYFGKPLKNNLCCWAKEDICAFIQKYCFDRKALHAHKNVDEYM